MSIVDFMEMLCVVLIPAMIGAWQGHCDATRQLYGIYRPLLCLAGFDILLGASVTILFWTLRFLPEEVLLTPATFVGVSVACGAWVLGAVPALIGYHLSVGKRKHASISVSQRPSDYENPYRSPAT